MEDAFNERDLKRLPQRRLNFIDGCISSYCSILNSHKYIEQIKQANKLVYFLCALESYRMREKEDNKKRAMEAEENRRLKSEENQVRKNEDSLRGLESCRS